jgi:ribonuclease BN (tRNA processing enzyme)
MALELTFLGTGNAFAPTRYWSSFLANGRYLFDAPPTLLAHLKRLGRDPRDIEVVFISHFHGDHYFGLPFLLLDYAELAPRSRDLTIVGPPGIAKRVQSVTDLAFSNVFRKDRGYNLKFIEVQDGMAGEVAGCTFTAHQVKHVDNLECFGFRVTCDHGQIAYSGDTVMCDALVPLAQGADVFVVECSCWGEFCGPHLNPANILQLRKEIDPSTTFILTHIGAGEAPAAITEAGILIADDLRTITIAT